MKITTQNLIKGAGIAASLCLFIIWIFFIINTQKFLLSQPAEIRQSWTELLPFPLVMIAFSLITAWASYQVKPKLLALFAILSFVSGGYYLLGANNCYAVGGLFSLILLYIAYRLAARKS